MTGQMNIFLFAGKRKSGSDTDLLFDKIHASHPLCDRMFHLDSGIHFHEIKSAIFIKKEFNRSGIFIPGCFCRFYCCLTHSGTKIIGNHLARRLLDHLLMISLDGAVTLSQMDHISKLICHDLKLDMSWMTHKMFHIHRGIAKSHLRFFLCSTETFFKICQSVSNSHSFAAASESSLDDDRIPDRFCFFHSLFYCVDWIFTAGNDRNTCICHRVFCRLFISKTCDHTGWRSDKSNITLLTKLCKTTVFGKETKSRMDCIGSCNDRRTDDIFHAEVALG